VSQFELARRALGDLQEIWDFVAEDSFTAAERLIEDFYGAFRRLAAVPGMGHKRQDLTGRDVLFWALYSYLIIYTSSQPLRVVRIIHAKRDVKTLLTR
jgi:plasmid stabilization system protein ParE